MDNLPNIKPSPAKRFLPCGILNHVNKTLQEPDKITKNTVE